MARLNLVLVRSLLRLALNDQRLFGSSVFHCLVVLRKVLTVHSILKRVLLHNLIFVLAEIKRFSIDRYKIVILLK
jgi:hypothetical protein